MNKKIPKINTIDKNIPTKEDNKTYNNLIWGGFFLIVFVVLILFAMQKIDPLNLREMPKHILEIDENGNKFINWPIPDKDKSGGGSGGVSSTADTGNPNAEKSAGKIKVGMSISEIEAIVGNSLGIPDNGFSIVSIDSLEAGSIMLEFENGKLVDIK